MEGKSVEDVATLGPIAHATLVNVNTTQMKGKTNVQYSFNSYLIHMRKLYIHSFIKNLINITNSSLEILILCALMYGNKMLNANIMKYYITYTSY